MLPPRFPFIWPSRFRGEVVFFKSTNHKQELPVVAMFVNKNDQFLAESVELILLVLCVALC
jgi:hypothetical protein